MAAPGGTLPVDPPTASSGAASSRIHHADVASLFTGTHGKEINTAFTPELT